jgi:NAD(P)H-hydrate epimerase
MGVAAPEPVELDEASVASLLPVRDPRGHKGSFGRVALVAGSLDFAGAALLAGQAALRGGAGVATLHVPASLQPVIAGRIPELITRGLPERGPFEVDPPRACAVLASEAHDALVVGPGLVPDRATVRMVSCLLASAGPPAVIDAGALSALATLPGWWRRVGRACVLTPHPGEFERLAGEPGGAADGAADPAAMAAFVAARWGQVVVLKGAGTVIATPSAGSWRSPFVVPLLATAGTGDVLAGLIGGLLGQGVAPERAAALGVFLHGRAGQTLTARLGDAGLLAGDLLDELPRQRAALAALAARTAGADAARPVTG